MRALAAVIGTMVPAAAYAAVDATGANDGIFVWIFLGFFALIVVGQLIPAVMLIVGMIKGATARAEAKTEVR